MNGIRHRFSLSLATLLVLLPYSDSLSGPPSTPDLPIDQPIVAVVSPPRGGGFVMNAGYETKIVVVLEITDATGHGLVTDDKGVPQFHAPDENATTLASYIETTGVFTNGLGQTVTQIIAVIPVRKLKIKEDSWLTPPIDIHRVTATDYPEGFGFPHDAMVEVAMFRFQIKDRSGAISAEPPASGSLLIGLATGTYAPPPNPDRPPS